MNEEQNYEDYDYTLYMKIEDVRLMYHCVQQTIKYWPGAPARPHEEQEHMWHLRDQFQRMILDHSFNNL
jgi:hypothetical protein